MWLAYPLLLAVWTNVVTPALMGPVGFYQALVEPIGFDIEEAFVRLDRTPCFGRCPAYTVTIKGDGTVVFEGRDFVAQPGTSTATIDQKRFVALANRFLAGNFYRYGTEFLSYQRLTYNKDGTWSVDDSAETDGPLVTLTMKLGEKEHSIRMYTNIPEELEALVDLVDEIAETEKYIQGVED